METRESVGFQFIPLIQLDPKDNLLKVTRYYQNRLEWKEIELHPQESFDKYEFLNRTRRHEQFKIPIKQIVLPEVCARSFNSWARDIDRDFRSRLEQLMNNKTLLKEAKNKLLLFCIRECQEAEMRYDSLNVFRFALDFHWKILDNDGKYWSVPFDYLFLTGEQLQMINEEFILRVDFFKWFRQRLETYVKQLEMMEVPEKLIKICDTSPVRALVEIIYGMETAGKIEYLGDDARVLARKRLAALFSVKIPNWAKIEAEIRSRNDASRVVRSMDNALQKIPK